MPNLGQYLGIRILRSIEARCIHAGQPLDSALHEPVTSYQGAESAPTLRRFLYRFGALRSTRDGQAVQEQLGRFVAEAASETSMSPERVLAVWRVFSGGEPVSLHLAVCGDRPLCSKCLLRKRCRYPCRKPTIRDLPLTERPRERLSQNGEHSLSTAELLGIILCKGTREQTAVGLAQVLLARFGDLRALSTRSIAELCEIPGIGPAKAAQVKAALVLGHRLAETDAPSLGDPFRGSRDVFLRFHPALRDLKKEVFKAVLLDRKNRILREIDVSAGSLTASIVHPREVLNPAIRESAAAIICLHNHPSGDPAPSPEDLELTRRLADACRIVGIALLDHVIIGDNRFFSFADAGLLRTSS